MPGSYSSVPRRLKVTGRGWTEDESDGLLYHAEDMVDDVRQGRVHRKNADYTPGFGTRHPQDLVELGYLDDPQPIPDARPQDELNLSVQDLGITDEMMRDHVRNGTPLPRGDCGEDALVREPIPWLPED